MELKMKIGLLVGLLTLTSCVLDEEKRYLRVVNLGYKTVNVSYDESVEYLSVSPGDTTEYKEVVGHTGLMMVRNSGDTLIGTVSMPNGLSYGEHTLRIAMDPFYGLGLRIDDD